MQAASVWQPQHGLILCSSAVAVAEDYFRSILTDVVGVCQICANRVKILETRMEYVFSGSVEDAVRGLLDRESFSSRDTIKEWAKKIAGMELSGNRSLSVALDEFERVCHVRHCAMHAGGYVSTRNAGSLGVPTGSWISFGSPAAIHEIISVVAATLRSFNQSLFEVLLGRWIDEGRLSGTWADDRGEFSGLWKAFRSKTDIDSSKFSGGPALKSTAYMAYRSVLPAITGRGGKRTTSS
ncbi:hypothetical protein ACFYTQ_35985 [Nocardia sp. NPDC004068]|uniref:hypothetical protein n=1 Tax=Nocardia sp. NPDC004068 TaxID=3364303 RepID=UPI0036D203F3